MKNFDEWNNIKKQIESKEPNVFPKKGEVWWVFIGKNIGFEQDGKDENFLRPVLVTKKFNNKMFWVIPLSSKQKSLDFYLNFIDYHNNNVSLILSQLKLLSVKRFQRKIYTLNKDIFNILVLKIIKILLD
jgi:mRNA interferase MazF